MGAYVWACVGPVWSYGSKPLEIPFPNPLTLPTLQCGVSHALDHNSSSLFALTCATSSVRPHERYILGRTDSFRVTSHSM